MIQENYLHLLKTKSKQFGTLSGTTPLFPEILNKHIVPKFTVKENREIVERGFIKELLCELTGYHSCELSIGASGALLNVFLFLKEKGIHELVLEKPYYQPYFLLAMLLGFKISFFDRTFQAIDQKIQLTKINSALLISNPHFFYGTKLNNDQLVKISNNFRYLIIDEVFYPQFDHNNQFGCGLNSSHIIAINSLSKSMGLSSLRFGWVAGSSKNISQISKVSLLNQVDIPSLTMLSSYLAIQNTNQIISTIKKNYQSNKNELVIKIQKHYQGQIRFSHDLSSGHFFAIEGISKVAAKEFCSSKYFGVNNQFRARIDRSITPIINLL